LHSEELHNLYSLSNIIRQIKREWGVHGRGEKNVQGFGGKTRKRPLKRRDVDGMALRETGWGL
jgi:hypothetical protein